MSDQAEPSGQCATCKFFSALQTECRKHPPRVFMIMHPTRGPAFVGAFSPVQGHHWCGEYEAKLAISN